ncbi:S41 family peptidase [Streptomyces sp. ICBB 8177]|uniref:S41 family peptidase n=1 Tax=Streptomyces sp. ICBB 8177 TaxID=563922 RepID=UPI000D6848C5|nr:S41 family peptidase [Streptomyces sp. ICBB 8177]PWI43091.1 peptidase S41 [Streptomyces sp. ICBB 8177]
MTQPSYLRNPHPHGDLIAFTAEDDVWLAPIDGGGRAWRVSADNVPVSRPRISPDGEHVAYASTRDGAPEVHLAPVDGGPVRRLTYWGAFRTQVSGWTPDGEVVAISPAGQATARRTWARVLPVDGGPARLLPYGPVGDLAYGPGDAVLLLSALMGREAAYWKRYRGGTAGKLWLDRDGDGTFERVHTGLDGNIECPMWVGDRIAFLSDHEGTGALYSSLPDGSDLRRHSPLDGFYARHAATDGTRVAYTAAGVLHLLDDLDGAEPRPLDIRLGGQRTDVQPYPVRAAHHLGGASPDHSGRGSAVEVRGTIHWLTHREGPARALSAEPGVRARLPRTYRKGGDGEPQVVWVTDAEGEDALEFAPATGVREGTEPLRLAAGRLGRVLELEVSPDGRHIAIASHDGRVLLVAPETGEVRTVSTCEDGDASGLAFSPDSGWLAWSQPGPEPLRQLRIASTATLAVADATPLRFNDFSPAFTADGKHLAFLSERAFDPVYDAHVFDLSFPNACRPHLITLAADTPSPFGPQRHGRAFGGGDDDHKADGGDKPGDGEAGPGQAAGGDEPRRAPVTRVDLEGLADRIVPFPVEAARYSDLKVARGGVLWLRHPLAGVLGSALATPQAEPPVSALQRYDLDRLRSDDIADDVDEFEVTGDGERLLLSCGGKLRVVPADSKTSDDDDDHSVTVDLSRVRVTVEPAAEWRQMFAETGRLMRDNFWRADMGGVDWDGVLERYRPVVDRLATHDDLVDLLWELQGELGTSHAYVSPRGGHGDALHRQGLLGADISRDADGVWRVDRVLPSETSDPQARSPLAAPGVAVRAGDALVAVDGRRVDPLTGPGPLLIGTAGKPVELTVRPAAGGEPRAVVVVPLADEDALRYHDWVADRRAHVHRQSGGRLGYLHVPDMVGSGWAQLHRDLRVEVVREGLVVDLRENRGGHTSQLVVEKLARKIIGWDVPRGMRPTSYPADAPRGPIVAVANEFAGSDGDIVNAAIKALGLGPVVGTRTWGGVIGIDSRYGLVDGTAVTQPKYATWMEGYGWGVENHGVDPDVEVPHTPQDWAAGRDPQLDTAIRLALEALAATPARSAPALPEV